MSENEDSIELICKILKVNENTIFTFKDFVENEFKKPLNEVENLEEVKRLHRAWNKSCESLLQIMYEMNQLSLKQKGVN